MKKTYVGRVTQMCDDLGITNPIQEKDLTVQSISFWDKDGKLTRIEATDMNRAGRLFFEYYIASAKVLTRDGVAMRLLQKTGRLHFGEFWQDAEREGQTLIAAFKQAKSLQIHLKEG